MIRPRTPNFFQARSIISTAKERWEFLSDLEITDKSATTIITGIYEAFRMLGDALLMSRGKEAVPPDSHTTTIDELLTLRPKTSRPVQVLSNLKDMRHKINYKGYRAFAAEATDVVEMSKEMFPQLHKLIHTEIESLSKIN